jgi:hypothetical protein
VLMLAGDVPAEIEDAGNQLGGSLFKLVRALER